MTWIVLILIVGECLILVKLLLWYQNRIQTLDTAEYPLKQRVEKHQERLQELSDDIRNSSENFLQQLEQDVNTYAIRTEYAASILAELYPEAFNAHEITKNTAQQKEEESQEQDDIGEDEVDDVIVLRKSDAYKVDVASERLNPEEMVQKILHELDETYAYMEALRRDAPIINDIASQVSDYGRMLDKE